MPDDESSMQWGKEGDLEEEKEEKEGGQLHIESKYQHFDSSAVDADKEMMVMPCPCHACGHMGESRMCVTDIPYFKEVIIMSFVCDYCGFRTNEVCSSLLCDGRSRRAAASPSRANASSCAPTSSISARTCVATC